MFVELSKQVENQYANNLPFVVYRKPKTAMVKAIFQNDDQLHYVDDFTETGFVFAPFDSSKNTILIPCENTYEAEYKVRNIEKSRNALDLGLETAQKEVHIALVKAGIAKIRQGDLKKVVLSRNAQTPCDIAPFDLFQKLMDYYPTAFCYLWHHPKVGTWLGATPEILVQEENQNIVTMSLAGTQKYTSNIDPVWGAKELEEQQLVTDYIASALRNLVTNLTVGERESVRAGNLWHLRTKLTAKIKREDLGKVIRALHPTPAVCGIPMDDSKTFILNNENYDRRYYTGFLGELNFKSKIKRFSNSKNIENKAYSYVKTKSTLFVNLRCMNLKEGIAKIYVGGGVTQDSDPEKEWQETVAKSKTMLRVFDW